MLSSASSLYRSWSSSAAMVKWWLENTWMDELCLETFVTAGILIHFSPALGISFVSRFATLDGATRRQRNKLVTFIESSFSVRDLYCSGWNKNPSCTRNLILWQRNIWGMLKLDPSSGCSKCWKLPVEVKIHLGRGWLMCFSRLSLFLVQSNSFIKECYNSQSNCIKSYAFSESVYMNSNFFRV